MSQKIKRRLPWGIACVILVALMILDIHSTLIGKKNRLTLLQPILKINAPTENSTVVIASSMDQELGNLAAPLGDSLTYEQVDAIVRRAIELDTSPNSLLNVIEDGDWVALKVNIVTAPLYNDGRNRTAYWYGGVPHDGQNTDLRVVKSIIGYLIEHENPARISIAEGGAEWPKIGESGTDPSWTQDGWNVAWLAFDNLSYEGIVAEFNAANPGLVDIVDLSYDSYRYESVPDPNATGYSYYQRPQYNMPTTVLDCDKWIDVAAMKTHDIPGVTLIHKLRIGTLANQAYGSSASGYGEMHNYGNDKVPAGFVDLFSFHPADYCFIECFWGTEGDGPQWGDDVQRNIVICGRDPVAVDAVGASVMGFNPWDIGYLHLSAAKGFGTFDMDYITVVGKTIDEVKYNFAKSKGASHSGTWIGRSNRDWLFNGVYQTTDLDGDSLDGEAGILPGEGDVNGGKTWGTYTSPENYVDLKRCFRGQSLGNVMSYAFSYIFSPTDQSGFLWLGSEDGIKVWLNGEMVFKDAYTGSYQIAEDKVAINLRAGYNGLLVKVKKGSYNYGFSVNVCDNDGDTMEGVTYTVDKSVVPVELISFTAVSGNGSIELTWSTVSETNNYGFGIERSRNKLSFEKIGFVTGNGTVTGQRNYNFIDKKVTTGHYYYRLKQIDTDGAINYSPIVEAEITFPSHFSLSQNYPNPFNPETVIGFEIPASIGGENQKATLKVYNVLGQEIRTLFDEMNPAGRHSVRWNGRDNNGLEAGSGIYLCQLRVGNLMLARKMLLTR